MDEQNAAEHLRAIAICWVSIFHQVSIGGLGNEQKTKEFTFPASDVWEFDVSVL